MAPASGAIPRSFGSLFGHFSLGCSEAVLYVLFGLISRFKLPLQLGVFYRVQDFAKNRPGLVAHLEQIVPAKQTWRADLFFRRVRQDAAAESVRLKPAVAGEAVEPVQLQMFLESRQPDKALQRRSPHKFDVLEPHVVGHQRHNLLRFFVGEAQPPGNVMSHPYANVHMPIDADAIARLLSGLKGRWLTHMLKKNAPGQR